MVERIAPSRVISFVLLAACGALCQSERPSVDVFQGLRVEGSNSPEAQHQEMRTWELLPDAPSVQLPTQAAKFQMLVNQARSPLTLGVTSIDAGVMRKTEQDHVIPGSQPSFTALQNAALTQKEASTFFDKYLYSSLLKQNLRYPPSTSGTFMGRVTDAASRNFITRDESGKARLNTSYFLGLLTSVVIHTAYRPYWARPALTTCNNFGSTIGSDAGLNLFHEFEPGLRKMVKGHGPKVVPGIEERMRNDQPPRQVVPTPAK
jgi:hypothetical protein